MFTLELPKAGKAFPQYPTLFVKETGRGSRCGNSGVARGERRVSLDWSKSVVEWQEENTVYLSVVFTWDLPDARRRAMQARMLGLNVKAGGPAVKLMPDCLADVADCDGSSLHDMLGRHNPWATRTSEGCPNRCPFCLQSRIGAGLREFKRWPVRPIVCDDNLLACSRLHFDRVIDKLKRLRSPYVDFNQGLDARRLTKHHADRLRELRCFVRLAFDSVQYESDFMRAYERLRAAGIPKSHIRVYVLIGFKDTPADALYRLRTVADLGIDPNPMRYQALDSLKKNEYVGEFWTHAELSRYMRYWANLRYMRSVPFEEWDGQKHPQPDPAQMTLF
jgi:hypothetical protein